MNLARRFLRYSFADRVLLVKVTLLVLFVRIGLNLIGFRRLRALLAKTAKKKSAPHDPARISRMAWAVAAASRHVPADASCLTQALSTEALLGRMGQRSDLRIGVARDGAELEAHAWLEVDGEVVIGDNIDISRFTAFSSLESGAG